MNRAMIEGVEELSDYKLVSLHKSYVRDYPTIKHEDWHAIATEMVKRKLNACIKCNNIRYMVRLGMCAECAGGLVER